MDELASEMHELFGTKVIVEPCDITDPQQVEDLKQHFIERLSTVDFAFLNAGVNVPSDDQDASEEVWTKTIE